MNKQYHSVDKEFLPLDRSYIRRVRNIRLIPKVKHRIGGKHSYAEWAHVIGVFQTLLAIHLNKQFGNTILDVGCGTGLMAIVSEPYLFPDGVYTGIDVRNPDIQFCRNHYPLENGFVFVHHNAHNAEFAPNQDHRIKWPFMDKTFDMVTALSVWTHLNKEDALFYFSEIYRVLKPYGKAIVTFFLLDELYEITADKRPCKDSRYNMTNLNQWIFDRPVYDSDEWYSPSWANPPEKAIGITVKGIQQLLTESGLKLVEKYQGNWKEVPGIYFQDVLVLQK